MTRPEARFTVRWDDTMSMYRVNKANHPGGDVILTSALVSMLDQMIGDGDEASDLDDWDRGYIAAAEFLRRWADYLA